MKKLIFGLLLFVLNSQVFSQITKLPEVVISAVNYKYLDAVVTEEADLTVKMMEQKVAMYDIKSSDLYSDEYDSYNVTFYIPDGRIVAAYDKDGNIIRTIEKFKNIKLPKTIRDAVFSRFPKWALADDAYSVIYHNDTDVVKKQYKVKLKNGKEVLRLKLDGNGNFSK